VREARRLAGETAESHLAILLSPGLGHLAGQIRARHIISVTRHPEIAALRPDLRMLVAPSPEELVRSIEMIPGWENGRITVFTGVHLDIDREYFESLRRAIEELIDRTAESVSTIRAFRDLWETNLAANAGLIRAAEERHPWRPRHGLASCRRTAGRAPRLGWVPALKERFAGATVFLLAAGPTLEEELPVLLAARDRGILQPLGGILLAVDSALPLLLSAGLVPDFCVTIDPQPVKARSLAGLGEIPLIGSDLSPPEILRAAKTLHLFAQGHPSEARHPIPREAVFEELGGSVATAGAVIAVRLGARRIVLVGQDLAILDRRFHARGTHHEAGRLRGLARFDSIEARDRRAHARRSLRPVESVAGGTVPTTPAMDSYRRFFGALAAAHPEVEIIQTSQRGARIDCIRRPLSEILENRSSKADNGYWTA
jgi:hypothetical protein